MSPWELLRLQQRAYLLARDIRIAEGRAQRVSEILDEVGETLGHGPVPSGPIDPCSIGALPATLTLNLDIYMGTPASGGSWNSYSQMINTGGSSNSFALNGASGPISNLNVLYDPPSLQEDSLGSWDFGVSCNGGVSTLTHISKYTGTSVYRSGVTYTVVWPLVVTSNSPLTYVLAPTFTSRSIFLPLHPSQTFSNTQFDQISTTALMDDLPYPWGFRNLTLTG